MSARPGSSPALEVPHDLGERVAALEADQRNTAGWLRSVERKLDDGLGEVLRGAASVSLDVGGTDPDGLIAAFDAFGTAAGSYDDPAGVKPSGLYSAQQLTATFTPDVGHNLNALTAGECTICVYYHLGY